MDKLLYKDYIKPGRVYGNIFFVGTRPASTHIIDTGDGLILIDPGLPETLWLVLENIRELDFNEKNIKVILLSHGHYDHAGAAKELAKISGAKVYLGKHDLKMVNGQENTSLAELFNAKYTQFFTPDVLLSDKDVVALGNTKVLCLSTPGHTDGTMSFFFDAFDGEKILRAGMHGGAGTNTLTKEFLQSHNLPAENREKFLKGIKYAKTQRVEIFLGNHVKQNNTEEKLLKVAKGEKNAFFAPDEWIEFLNTLEVKLNKLEKREKDMQKTIEAILKEKIIVIVRGVKRDKLISFAQAAYRGGIRLLECTYDAGGNTSDEEIAQNIKMLSEHFLNKMVIGAGTVLTEKQVELTKAAGGRFIISPDTNPDVIKKTKKEGLVSIPGAITPSEAVSAHNAGADFVKLFPIGCMGEKYIKDIKAPLSHIRFLAVGGLNTENMLQYYKNGACGFGIGSDIVNKKLIEQNNFEEIEKIARKYTQTLSAVEGEIK